MSLLCTYLVLFSAHTSLSCKLSVLGTSVAEGLIVRIGEYDLLNLLNLL